MRGMLSTLTADLMAWIISIIETSRPDRQTNLTPASASFKVPQAAKAASKFVTLTARLKSRPFKSNSNQNEFKSKQIQIKSNSDQNKFKLTHYQRRVI
jgi:hypothetical protein